MKKISVLLLSLITVFTLVACNGDTEKTPANETDNAGTTQTDTPKNQDSEVPEPENSDSDSDANTTITGHSLKAYANENSCTIYFENGLSVKIEVEETLGDNYSDTDKEQYRKQKENVYGGASLDGNIVKYTITEDPMYIGVPRDYFLSGAF